MGMKLLMDDVTEIADGIWLVGLPPHEVQLLGSAKVTQGNRSVLLVGEAMFDENSMAVQVDASSVTVLNQGTTPETIIVRSPVDASKTLGSVERVLDPVMSGTLGPGDMEFLRLVQQKLTGEAREAARALLHHIRSGYPGDLKRGQRSNFTNVPDNFWYVIVQPRVQSLSVTVRGHVERFHPEKLKLKADRPGYTRFALSRLDEVPGALSIIEQSKRK